jgi:hypothetical protein
MKNVILMIALFSLTSCDKVKNSLGMDHYQADEFNVPENQPLSLPPNHDLRPPMDGKEMTKADTQSQAAKKLIGTPKAKTPNNGKSGAEKKVLEKINSQNSDQGDDIRSKVDKESQDEPKGAVENKINDWGKQFKKNLKSASTDKTKENKGD